MDTPTTATLSFTVTDDDTAAALGSGSLPVLATPRLLAWCEAATCAAVTTPPCSLPARRPATGTSSLPSSSTPGCGTAAVPRDGRGWRPRSGPPTTPSTAP